MKRKKILFLCVAIVAALVFLPKSVLATYTYTPMEQIPGFSATGDFPTYITNLYKFGLWTIGLAALLMISIGGFMYITSAGNNALMGKAKGIITDAIIGVLLAMVTYLLLYTINPDLVKFTPLTALPMPTSQGSSSAASQAAASQAIQQQLAQCQSYCNGAGATGSDGTAWTQNCLAGCTQNAQNAQQAAANGQSASQIAQNQTDCNNYCAAGGSDTSVSQNDCYSQCMAAKSAQAGTPTQTAINQNTPTSCNDPQIQQLFTSVANSTGVDKCVLQATAAKESGCNLAVQSTNGGRDCTFMQIDAQDNCNQTCDALQQDPTAALTCAANYIKSYSSKTRSGNVQDIYAGYNGGAGVLGASSDCPGQLKYECQVNCGGLCSVPQRTAIFQGFYNQCQGSST